ncbi:unnamed protein product [Camellia sinensis]
MGHNDHLLPRPNFHKNYPLTYPAQDHINPIVKLSKLLHQRGFHITFVNTEFNHKRLLKSRGPDSLNGLSSFWFESIPDGLPESDADATQDNPSLCEFTRKHCLAPFKDLLSKLNDTASSNVPPVTCIVSDGIMSFTVDAAEELGIPEVLLWTASACGFMGYEQYRNLIDKGFIPLKELHNKWVFGYSCRLDTRYERYRLKDLPSFLRTTDLSDFMSDFVFGEIERARKASAIIFNTFENLEHNVLEALSSMFPPTYAIGPLHLLMNQINDDSLKLIGSNLWKEEPECLQWLDTKEPNSAVYVNFGSITVMTPKQMAEPDLVTGDLAVLPSEFMEATKERGLLASWCPQEQVLDHPSIGGFLTHSGWISTLESISSGVPMVCWPFSADQQTNCWHC